MDTEGKRMRSSRRNGIDIVDIDITNQCDYRCLHCYFFVHDYDKEQELSDDEWTARLDRLCEEEGVDTFPSGSWTGGEPLLREELIRKGMKYFKHNVVVTNGRRRLPDWPDVHFYISVDGPKEMHNLMRGGDWYDLIVKNVLRPDLKIFVSMLITRRNYGGVERFVEDWWENKRRGGEVSVELENLPRRITETFAKLGKNSTKVSYDADRKRLIFEGIMSEREKRELEELSGEKLYKDAIDRLFRRSRWLQVLFQFYTPVKGLENLMLWPDWDLRDKVVDRLIKLKEKYGDFISLSSETFELMRSDISQEVTLNCSFPSVSRCLDPQGRVKKPCMMGPLADCSRCGCVLPFYLKASMNMAYKKASG